MVPIPFPFGSGQAQCVFVRMEEIGIETMYKGGRNELCQRLAFLMLNLSHVTQVIITL